MKDELAGAGRGRWRGGSQICSGWIWPKWMGMNIGEERIKPRIGGEVTRK
jgi:hypothetical protein